MTDGHQPRNTPRHMPFLAAVLMAAVLLLPAAPADAGLLGRSIGVGGVGHSLKKNLGRLIDRAGEMADASMDGDSRRAQKIWEDVKKTPARIIKDAFPVFGIAAAAKDRLKSAENKIKSFVGKASEAVSGAGSGAGGRVRSLVTDARAALAVSDKERNLYGARTGILGTKPLPAASTASTSPASTAKAASGGSGSPWFRQWVMKQLRDYPECYGIVEADSDLDECIAKAKARKEVEKKAKKSVASSASGSAGASNAKGRGWTVDDREFKKYGWGGWDRSDSRYNDEDREAARVSLYASRCWGVDWVTEYDPTFPLMKRRMLNNECPEEDKVRNSAGDAEDGYEKALSKTHGEDGKVAGEALDAEDKARSAADGSKGDYEKALSKALGENDKADGDPPEEGGYQAALNALDAKEEEQRRAEEERQRQAKLAEQRRRDTAALAKSSREHSRKAQTASSVRDSGAGKGQQADATRRTPVAIVTEPKCVNTYKNCWLELSSRAGCGIFLRESILADGSIIHTTLEENIIPDIYRYSRIRRLQVTWSGLCSGGIAVGKGVINISVILEHSKDHAVIAENVAEITGEILPDGTRHGKWTLQSNIKYSGTAYSEYQRKDEVRKLSRKYINGKLNGKSVYTKIVGDVTDTVEEHYVNDKRHGRYKVVWLLQYSGLTRKEIFEGNYFEGNRHGKFTFKTKEVGESPSSGCSGDMYHHGKIVLDVHVPC